MAEKLKRAHCQLPGHGDHCIVALERLRDQQRLGMWNRLRRRRKKRVIQEELDQSE